MPPLEGWLVVHSLFIADLVLLHNVRLAVYPAGGFRPVGAQALA